MSEPRRPDPQLTWSEQVRERLDSYRERLRSRREWRLGLSDQPLSGQPPLLDQSLSGNDASGEVVSVSNEPRSSAVLGGLLAIGVTLVSLGLVWGIQTWRHRSAVPIDELLPMLEVITEPEPTVEQTQRRPAEVPWGSSSAAIQAPAVAPDSPSVDQQPPSLIIVHVSGAVVRPGVVETGPTSRVFEVVELAGGVIGTADLDRINLAAEVLDGQRIHIPRVGEDPLSALVSPGQPEIATDSQADTDPATILDLNHATPGDLESLPGVGPAIAEAIVRTREQRGPFLTVDELQEVPGIGESKLALIRPRVVVG